MNKFRKAVEKAQKAHDKASNVIWDICRPDNLRFSEGFKLAPDAQQIEYRQTQTVLLEAEQYAVSNGKAWRSGSMLYWN